MVIVIMDVKWYRWQRQSCFLNGSWNCPSPPHPSPANRILWKQENVCWVDTNISVFIIESSVIFIKTSILHLTQSFFPLPLALWGSSSVTWMEMRRHGLVDIRNLFSVLLLDSYKVRLRIFFFFCRDSHITGKF